MSSLSVPKLVGARIKTLRTSAGLTQAQVSEASGIAVETVSRLESGQNMTIGVAARIADALGAPLAALFEGREPPARALSPAEARVVALLRTLDERSKNDLYRALRLMVPVRQPNPVTRPARSARNAKK